MNSDTKFILLNLNSSTIEETTLCSFQSAEESNVNSYGTQMLDYAIAKDDCETTKLNDYLCWSLFNTIFFSCTGMLVLFFSLPALIFSLITYENIRMGYIADAKKFSAYSRNCNILATIVVVATLICIAVFLGYYFLLK